MFCDVRVGDVLRFKLPLKRVGRNRGTYAPTMLITNDRTGEATEKTMNEIGWVLPHFELQEVYDE